MKIIPEMRLARYIRYINVFIRFNPHRNVLTCPPMMVGTTLKYKSQIESDYWYHNLYTITVWERLVFLSTMQNKLVRFVFASSCL